MENKSNTKYFLVNRLDSEGNAYWQIAGREIGLGLGKTFHSPEEASAYLDKMNFEPTAHFLDRGRKTVSLNGYQAAQVSLLIPTADLQYAKDNLAGEVGELMSIFAKEHLKGHTIENTMTDPEIVRKLKGELGDILFMTSLIALRLGFTLEDVANANLEKLTKRFAEKKIIGEGDFR